MRSRRAPLPRLVVMDDHNRVRYPLPMRDRVLTALIWIGSFLLVTAFSALAFSYLGGALAVLMPAAVQRPRCDVCDGGGNLVQQLAKVRVAVAEHAAILWLCGRHLKAAQALKGYLRRRERKAVTQ